MYVEYVGGQEEAESNSCGEAVIEMRDEGVEIAQSEGRIRFDGPELGEVGLSLNNVQD